MYDNAMYPELLYACTANKIRRLQGDALYPELVHALAAEKVRKLQAPAVPRARRARRALGRLRILPGRRTRTAAIGCSA
jgi:hypothetical protein